MLLLTLLILVAAALAVAIRFVVRKARQWDFNPQILAAKQQERLNAPEIVRVFSLYFDELDVSGAGLITRSALALIAGLEAPDCHKDLLTRGIANAQGRVDVFINPWLLGPFGEYRHERLGHFIGTHTESVIGPSVGGVGAYACDVEVDDYGISRHDLRTYVSRVSQHQRTSR